MPIPKIAHHSYGVPLTDFALIPVLGFGSSGTDPSG